MHLHSATKARLGAYLAASLALLLLVATAAAMDITGTIRVPDDYVARVRRTAPPARTFYWEEWNGFLDPRPDSIDVARELAIVLTGNGPEPTDHNVTIQWRGGSLMPSTVVVRPGTILAIENHDDVIHELSSAGLREIAPEATGSGSTRRTLALTRPGHFVLNDALVPHSVGHLHVIANVVAVAAPQANGTFTFANIAAGQYVLKVFHGERELTSRTVEVAEGHPLTIDPITLSASGP